MGASHVFMAAAEGGIIGDGRTGANLALGVGFVGVVIGWLALTRATGRTGALSAMAVGLAGTLLAILHLATSDGGPGTGNGMVGAVLAIPLGLAAMALGLRGLTRSHAAVPHERTPR